MTKCYLDSNVLIYWKIGEKRVQKQATDLLLKLRQTETTTFISPLCLDEFIKAIITEARKDNQKTAFSQTRQAVNDALDLPLLSIINPPDNLESQMAVVKLMEDFSLRPRDAYHLLTMQANKIGAFATFDTDFSKVFFAKILKKISF